MIDSKEIALRKIETLVKCDITQLIVKKIDAIARKDDKEFISDLYKTVSNQDVEILGILVNTEEKIIEKTAKYIEERTFAYEKGMQYKRLFGFKRKAEILSDAREAAIRAGKAYHRSISVTSNPIIKSIVNQRIEHKKILLKQLSNLIENTEPSKQIDLDKVLKMIPY